jgi:hypothetical protein
MDIDARATLEQILKKYNGRLWSGLIWLRIGASGGLI